PWPNGKKGRLNWKEFASNRKARGSPDLPANVEVLMLAELAMIAASCAPDIHLTTLKAVVKHESGFNQFAIGVNKGKKLDRQPSSHSEAVEVARSLIADGVDFDAGLGQINVRNWGWL